MKEHIAARLAELKKEFQNGEAQLRDLTQQEVVLRETLLRISGAIQVLEELAASDGSSREGTVDHSASGAEVLTVP